MLWLPGKRIRLLSDPKKLGIWGQHRAERYLKSKNMDLIGRNFRFRYGEVDLIMQDNHNRAVVFVEVKTRKSETFATAQESVNFRKQQKLIKTAQYFCKMYKIKNRPLRFDVVAVVLPEKGKLQIRHYPNAFKP